MRYLVLFMLFLCVPDSAPAVTLDELEELVQNSRQESSMRHHLVPFGALLIHLLLFRLGGFLHGRGFSRYLRYFPGSTIGAAAPLLLSLYAGAIYCGAYGARFQSIFMDPSPIFEHAKPSNLVPTIILFVVAIGVHMASIAMTRLKTQEAEPT